jgi:hypothetical protein
MLGDPALADETAFVDYFRRAVKGTEVHSIHTEVEGTAKADLFRRQLEAWKSDGVSFLPLCDYASEEAGRRNLLPVRRLVRTTIPNRGGEITTTA